MKVLMRICAVSLLIHSSTLIGCKEDEPSASELNNDPILIYPDAYNDIYVFLASGDFTVFTEVFKVSKDEFLSINPRDYFEDDNINAHILTKQEYSNGTGRWYLTSFYPIDRSVPLNGLPEDSLGTFHLSIETDSKINSYQISNTHRSRSSSHNLTGSGTLRTHPGAVYAQIGFEENEIEYYYFNKNIQSGDSLNVSEPELIPCDQFVSNDPENNFELMIDGIYNQGLYTIEDGDDYWERDKFHYPSTVFDKLHFAYSEYGETYTQFGLRGIDDHVSEFEKYPFSYSYDVNGQNTFQSLNFNSEDYSFLTLAGIIELNENWGFVSWVVLNKETSVPSFQPISKHLEELIGSSFNIDDTEVSVLFIHKVQHSNHYYNLDASDSKGARIYTEKIFPID